MIGKIIAMLIIIGIIASVILFPNQVSSIIQALINWLNKLISGNTSLASNAPNTSTTSTSYLISHRVFPNTTPISAINKSYVNSSTAQFIYGDNSGMFSNTTILYKLNGTIYWIPESFNTTYANFSVAINNKQEKISHYWQNLNYLNGKTVELAVGQNRKLTNTTPITYLNATFKEVNNTYNFYIIRNVANTTTVNYYNLSQQPIGYYLYGFKYNKISFYNISSVFPATPNFK